MNRPTSVTQSPLPGQSLVMYAGDTLALSLDVQGKGKGKAFVRTNFGAVDVARNEIINRVEKDEIKLDEAWYDIPMEGSVKDGFKIVLPLHETGFFQAKCYFLPENDTVPVWPGGDNTRISVEPAATCCANIIYNAFVRQFGATKERPVNDPARDQAVSMLDEKGYTVIPESGKFRDLAEQVPFIFDELGCRALLLLPIHPTPTTYARMGRFGSPYAALNFTQVDPALARFDPAATPLDQFMELTDRVHACNGYLFMDIAVNHTGWAAAIHETHPEWLLRGKDNEIQNPGAWGVVWADLTSLDYTRSGLWTYIADIFLHWCKRGVDGFRCDAGYMIPVEAWEYIVAKVRRQYPGTLFFLEGLGGPVAVTREILSRANFNWAYSELFQNYSREEISGYLPGAFDISRTCGHTIHFAETHDNNRLAARSETYAAMRTALCALFSVNGGFGFANGVEWFAKEKIDVHESRSLNWGSPVNQVDRISRMNRILAVHPAFFAGTDLSLIQENHDQCLVLLRQNKLKDAALVILVNLDCERPGRAVFPAAPCLGQTPDFFDLLTGDQVTLNPAGDRLETDLSPGQVMALTPRQADLALVNGASGAGQPLAARHQRLKAEALRAFVAVHGYKDVSGLDLEKQAGALGQNPRQFIRSLYPDAKESRVIVLDTQKDLHRNVMIPPGFFFLIVSPYPFRAWIMEETAKEKKSVGYRESLSREDGTAFFALFHPMAVKEVHQDCFLDLRIFQGQPTRVERIGLMFLAPFDKLVMNYAFTRKEIIKSGFLKLLGTTRHGGMVRAAVCWPDLYSRYDALLAANLSATTPEDRWMVLSRCRIWAVFQGYSRELAPDCLDRFVFSHAHGGQWRFHVPTSQGKYYVLNLKLALDRNANAVTLSVERKKAKKRAGFLEDDRPVSLIFRPDIEDRSFHEPVKAFAGPEHDWPRAVSAFETGFDFSLSRGQTFRLDISSGQYFTEPEWHYMVYRPLEAQRGLDPDSDLFSPGYFIAECLGGNTVSLWGRVGENEQQLNAGKKVKAKGDFPETLPLEQAVYNSMDAFLVDRDKDKSVIAGYPWFLDWGRDSLIFCRGLIELGRLEDARAVLKLFGRFENKGTLPNMIRGKDAGNIETSDAPLWFFTCCKELCEKEGNYGFLDEKLSGRTIKEILFSMAGSMINGTPTGVKADPDTLLLYSPSHFTWMDTNYPAGSPRQGYPVEIQGLWHHALSFLADISGPDNALWADRARQVRTSVNDLFYLPDKGYFSDCLHGDGPVGAKNAGPDDALRPNQLFLIPFGVVDDPKKACACLETCMDLLVPGGIRSLSDRPLETGLHIFYNDQLLNDPHRPYAGTYQGDEDTKRKPAYHNGTAWTWPFPVFCEAWAHVFGPKSHATCLAWLGSVADLMRTGSAGYIPEILDGDFPHAPRGCDAQAWSSSEFARVIHKLKPS